MGLIHDDGVAPLGDLGLPGHSLRLLFVGRPLLRLSDLIEKYRHE